MWYEGERVGTGSECLGYGDRHGSVNITSSFSALLERVSRKLGAIAR